MTKEERKPYLDRKDIIIENNTARWNLSCQGAIQGTYTGTFVFKCFLTPSERLQSGRDYREMLGNNAVLALKHEENLAFTLSQLKYRVVSGPPFWGSSTDVYGVAGNIPDENVLEVIFDAALSAEFKYLAILEEKKEKAIERVKKVAEELVDIKRKDDEEVLQKNKDKKAAEKEREDASEKNDD